MIPAFGMVILPQNPSTCYGQIPGRSCILSVAALLRVSLDFKWSVTCHTALRRLERALLCKGLAALKTKNHAYTHMLKPPATTLHARITRSDCMLA